MAVARVSVGAVRGSVRQCFPPHSLDPWLGVGSPSTVAQWHCDRAGCVGRVRVGL